ncbi:hypothetical protein NQ176_g9826 [Zarea fungicola]|uniref:Uncharacterized protein n=1 Tax=Zarea fungicola TaxID=93591 RepID=A0ACC1MLK6_9HYPO|nr:hypothetical protein NQ176_g9826 [Lecanicillium fungicola]
MTEELLREKVFEGMHEAHEAVLGPLNELDSYLSRVAANLSGPELVAILDALHPPLESHFNDEVQRIASFATHRNAPEPGSTEEK